MTPTTMDTEDTLRTQLLTVCCESMTCDLSACIGFFLVGLSSYRFEQLHHSLLTIQCQHLTFKTNGESNLTLTTALCTTDVVASGA